MKPLSLVAALAVASAPLISADEMIFHYDQTTDLAVERHGETLRDGARIVDITFASDPTDTGTRTRAFLVLPVDPAALDSASGILWGHWLGEPETTNRTQFLDEAVAWAGRGAVSILTESMWATPGWYRARVLDQDFANGVKQVIAFRRAMDLLLAQPGVDPARTAFVAHDYSAMYGSMALAADDRISHAVFIAAAPTLEDWAFYTQQPADKDVYVAQNRPLHLPDHLARLSSCRVLLQWAEEDFYVPPERREAFIGSLVADKVVKVYPGAGHEMSAPPAILDDRTAWLMRVLGVE